ncbi:hypothetical protein LIU39_33340, partial [Streptomyces sp. SF28]|nr:hypothetical protein [Streptomyces pinistramenti]
PIPSDLTPFPDPSAVRRHPSPSRTPDPRRARGTPSGTAPTAVPEPGSAPITVPTPSSPASSTPRTEASARESGPSS